MANLVRKGKGKPLRDAMEQKGLSGNQLAAATKIADIRGRGVGKSIVCKIAGKGPDGDEPCRLRTAWLMATVLDEPLQELFDMPTVSTDTVERSTPHGDSR
jgi:hypothetical protein